MEEFLAALGTMLEGFVELCKAVVDLVIAVS